MTREDLDELINDTKKCNHYFESQRWGDKKICPYCASEKVGSHEVNLGSIERFQCRWCKNDFTVKTHTFFHNTKLPLNTWVKLIDLMYNISPNISGQKASSLINIGYKTTWHMIKRIKMAENTEKFDLIKPFILTENK